MNKTFRAVLAVCLALVLGVFAVILSVLLLPEQFDDIYLGELADKYARLRSLDDENKIVIIGGSSVPFGIDSAMIEQYLGLPAVNFGLYGPLGTAVMMDLTRGHIREGDIVVLAPETDPQTMSMTFNGEAMWECCDSDFTMLFKIRGRDWGEMLGSFWIYASKKYQFYLDGKPEPDGVYDHDSFNEYGDIVYPRAQSVMDEGYDPDILVDLDPDIVDPDYIDYVNDYVAYCERQGASVYFSWPPMNEAAVQQDSDGILAFATFVRESFRCPLISNISDYILESQYFYDTNYHVTDRGVVLHTARLIQDLQNVIGDGSLIEIPESSPEETGASGEETSSGELPVSGEEAAETAPEPTPEPTPEPVGSSRDADCFTCREYIGGVIIDGVTDEGMARTELEIPWLIGGQKVVAIDRNAFDGCGDLQTLYIQSNVTRIMQGAFDGAPKLLEIHIDNDDGANILIPGSGLFDNVPSRLKVYVPKSAYGFFLADYFWGNYNDRLAAEPD